MPGQERIPAENNLRIHQAWQALGRFFKEQALKAILIRGIPDPGNMIFR